MSLWTPGGEVSVNRDHESANPNGPSRGSVDAGATGVVGGPSLDELSPEERAEAEAMIAEMAEVQRQIAATPAAHLIANHLMGFYELAAIKLGQKPPMFAEAQLAIDAMNAVLDALGDRLGDDRTTLRDGLTQLQMAFVQLKSGGEQASTDA